MTDDITVAVRADTTSFAEALQELERLSGRFGSELAGSLRNAVVGGRTLEDTLRRLGTSLAGMALDQGLKPLQNLAGSAFSSLLGGLPSLLSGVVPFAQGGVVSSPTLFPGGDGLGLMGEAGAEAIMPLRRGPDGRLGIAAAGGTAPVAITFNVTAPDPATFSKSEAQISQLLARAVSRGLRSM